MEFPDLNTKGWWREFPAQHPKFHSAMGASKQISISFPLLQWEWQGTHVKWFNRGDCSWEPYGFNELVQWKCVPQLSLQMESCWFLNRWWMLSIESVGENTSLAKSGHQPSFFSGVSVFVYLRTSRDNSFSSFMFEEWVSLMHKCFNQNSTDTDFW